MTYPTNIKTYLHFSLDCITIKSFLKNWQPSQPACHHILIFLHHHIPTSSSVFKFSFPNIITSSLLSNISRLVSGLSSSSSSSSSHQHCCPTSADWSPVCQSSRFLFIFIAGHLPFTHQSHSNFQSIYNVLSFLLSLSCIRYSAASSGECFKLWQENFSKFSS